MSTNHGYINSPKCEITLALAVSCLPLGCAWRSGGLVDIFWLQPAARYLLLTATAAAWPRYTPCALVWAPAHAYLCDFCMRALLLSICTLAELIHQFLALVFLPSIALFLFFSLRAHMGFLSFMVLLFFLPPLFNVSMMYSCVALRFYDSRL